jgi:hypothetical protein
MKPFLTSLVSYFYKEFPCQFYRPHLYLKTYEYEERAYVLYHKTNEITYQETGQTGFCETISYFWFSVLRNQTIK